MATLALTTVEQYLKTVYRPDCDYVEGQVQERNLGEREHSGAQSGIVFFSMTRYPALRGRVLAEQRVRVSTSRFRIPDICVLTEDAPWERIIATLPALCIEILSPEDRMSRTMERLNDYFAMGVPICWVIDPVSREGWTATPGHFDRAPGGILRAGELEMPLAEVLPIPGSER